jgi:hypothetical protein
MARDLHIVIKANIAETNKAFENFLSNRHWIDPTPIYRSNAALIGAYHAHKGAGYDYSLRWFQSLGLRDRKYIEAYEQLGEWGRTDLRTPYDIGVGMVFGISAGILPYTFTRVADAYRKQYELDMIDAKWTPSSTPSSVDFEGAIEVIERLKLRRWLEAWRLPSSVACWLAKRWPKWALPLMLYSWIVCTWAKWRDNGKSSDSN